MDLWKVSSVEGRPDRRLGLRLSFWRFLFYDTSAQGFELSAGVFRVALATVNGENYFLEFKSSLTEGIWTELQTVAGDGTLRTMVDPSATGPRGFYRVRVE